MTVQNKLLRRIFLGLKILAALVLAAWVIGFLIPRIIKVAVLDKNVAKWNAVYTGDYSAHINYCTLGLCCGEFDIVVQDEEVVSVGSGFPGCVETLGRFKSRFIMNEAFEAYRACLY